MFYKKWILALCVLIPVFFSFASEEIKHGALVFEEQQKNCLTVVRYEGGQLSVVIPEQIDGKNVTAISSKIFYYLTNDTIQEVYIPKTVTSIGFFNFAACTSLKRICVDEENPAFSSKDGVLYNKDQTILIQAPGGLAGKYTIPDTVKELGRSAFYGCSKIDSLALPKSFESYGEYTFGGPSVSYALEIDPRNPRFSTSDEGFLLSKDGAEFLMCTDKLITRYEIPVSVKKIGRNAFESCSEMAQVSLPPNIEQIDDSAFSLCHALDEIELRAGLQSIGERAFYGCTFETVDIPASVRAIGAYAFARCENLEKITIPGSVQRVPERLFWNCKNLRKIKIENGVESIGASFVENCEKLRKADVPSNVVVSPGAWKGSPLEQEKN